MKKTYLFLPVILLSLSATNCNTEKAMIKNTAYGYLDAMGNYRFTDAVPFASQQTQQTTLQYIQNNIMPNIDSSYLEKNTPATIKIKDIRMVNDSVARVAYHKNTPITHQNDTLTLVKHNGQWRAHVLINVPPVVKGMLGDAPGSDTDKTIDPNKKGKSQNKTLKKLISDTKNKKQ